MKSAGRMMRDFKTNITSDYIYPLAEDGLIDELQILPKKYPELDLEDWRTFVSHRLSPEIMVLLCIYFTYMIY